MRSAPSETDNVRLSVVIFYGATALLTPGMDRPMPPAPRPRVRTRTLSSTSRPAIATSPALQQLTIEHVSPSDLKSSKTKLRKHPEPQIECIVASLRRFGFVSPILVDEDNNVIAGEAILEAAKRLGMKDVPVVRIEGLSDAEKRALRLALNKLPELASWDPEVLKAELTFLSSVDFELVTFTGFSTAEIDVLTATPTKGDEDLEVSSPPLPDQVVSRLSDIWLFAGGHKLGCFDALDEEAFAALFGDEKAGLTISDPPFNVPIQGHVTRRPGAREFAMASGEMTPAAFIEFLATSFRNSDAYSRDGSLSFQFIDWRHIDEMSAAGRQVYGELLNIAVWAKSNPGMGTPWRSGYELCFVWKKGGAPHVDNVKLGRVGRNRSNVWRYPGANQHRDRGSEGHVTPKNLAMIQDAILDVTNRADIVLDAFAGSGTTLVAAHLTGRHGYGLEIDPAYVDLAIRRMEARTGAPARHAESGLTFAEMAVERGVPLPAAVRAR